MDLLKAIIFDFDGVIVDSVNIKGDAFALLYKEQGKEIQDQMRAYHQDNGGMQRKEKLYNFETQILNRQLSRESLDILLKRFAEIVKDEVIRCPSIKGTINFLEQNHKKLPLFIVSATPQEELMEIIIARNLNRYFCAVYGSPNKKAFHIQNILNSLNISTRQAIMIGDARADYEAAAETNIHFLARRDDVNDNFFPDHIPVIQDLVSLSDYLQSKFILPDENN